MAPEMAKALWSSSGGRMAMSCVVPLRQRDEVEYLRFRLCAISTWHTYTVKAVWSHNPSEGRLEFYLDGKLKRTITGRDVNLGPNSNRLPTMKLGMYGDYAVGVIDVDNVKAGPSSGRLVACA